MNCSDGYKIQIQIIKDGNRLIGKEGDKLVKMFLIKFSASFGFSPQGGGILPQILDRGVP